MKIFLALLLVLGCGHHEEPKQQIPATATASFAKAAARCSGGLDDPGAAAKACGDLAGAGNCGAAWQATLGDAALSQSAFMQRFHKLLVTCADQYCPTLATKPDVCSGLKLGNELSQWTELHAAIMDTLYGDDLHASPGMVAAYRALPANPRIADLEPIMRDRAASEATLPGRAVKFGLFAKLVGAYFFQPSLDLLAPHHV